MPRGVNVTWPADEEILSIAQAAEEGGVKPAFLLSEKYGSSPKRAEAVLLAARRRQEAANQPCDRCGGAGFVGGGDSGVVCRCAKGAAIAQALTEQAHLAAQIPYTAPTNAEITPEVQEQMEMEQTKADAILAEAEQSIPEESLVHYLQFEATPPLPVVATLHLLEADDRGIVHIEAGEYVPDEGDQWPELIRGEGPVKVRIWHCLVSHNDLRVLIPLAGVTLKPLEVA